MNDEEQSAVCVADEDPEPPPAGSRWLHTTLSSLIAHLLAEHTQIRFGTLGAAALAFENVTDEALRADVNFARGRHLFTEIAGAVRKHMTREEHLLFPLVEAMERAWAEEADLLPRLERGLSPVIEHLLAEHADIVRRLAQLRRCRLELHCSEHEECAEVLMRMRDLEARLQECIDLESAVLFPRALKLEEALYPVRS